MSVMLCSMNDVTWFRQIFYQWVEEALNVRQQAQNPDWSKSIAIGSERFIEEVKAQLGVSAR